MSALRRLSMPAVVAALAVSGCSLWDSDEPGQPVIEQVGAEPEVRAELNAILSGRASATREDMRSVLLDGEALAQFGDRLLGTQLATLTRDMSELSPRAYGRRHGASPERTALALGRLLRLLAVEIDAALADASDEQRIETIEWAFEVGYGVARYWWDFPASGERIARLVLPRDAQVPDASFNELATRLAPLLAQDPPDGRDPHRAAELLLEAAPETGGGDVIAALAGELSERIPARYLSAFLTAYDLPGEEATPEP